MPDSSELDARMRGLLVRAESIAVVGIKADASEDANRVPRYMQDQGYRILPVNPKLDHVLGENAFASLHEVDTPIDLVNLFRAPRFLAQHVDEILRLDPLPLGVWTQLGIRDDTQARRLSAAGIEVVQDRCLLVEHRRLAPKSRGSR